MLCVLIGAAPTAAFAQDDEPATAAVADEQAPAPATTDSLPADDDTMPPMAQAAHEPVPAAEEPPADASVLTPSVQQWPAVIPPVTTTSGHYDPPATPASGAQAAYVEPVGDTHPALRLTPDKSEIIRLDRPAASVIVGNEAHVSIFIDSPTRLVAVPRQPGASYFTALDAQGRVIMRRHVIVGSPAEHYVRVRRSCPPNDRSCEPTSVFYCPGGLCHPITTQQTPANAPNQPNILTSGGVPMTGANAGLNQDNDYVSDNDSEAPNMNGFQFMPVIPFPFSFGSSAPTPE
jgi:hypothetical protein